LQIVPQRRWIEVMTPIREVFACASWTPIALPDAEKVLRALEARLNHGLPGTFRELMALENGPALIEHFSNSDIALPPRRLAEPWEERWPGYDPLEERLLPFKIENQGSACGRSASTPATIPSSLWKSIREHRRNGSDARIASVAG
jgi:hypothetical protein